MITSIPTGMNGTHSEGGQPGPQLPKTPGALEAALMGKATASGYKPNLPVGYFHYRDGGIPPYWEFLRDVEAMRRHPHVRDCLNIYMGGIWPAKFKIKASTPEVAEFVGNQLRRYWTRSLRAVQDDAYSYGFVGAEVVYCEERGRLMFEDMVIFHPRDARPLTRRNQFVGLRVRSSRPMGVDKPDDSPDDRMTADLWAAGPNRPGKAFWYAHNSRHSQWFGESQLIGAWRPFRRLAYPDGADEVIDGGVYRFAYQGPTVYAPPGSEKTTRPGGERRDFIDLAREMAEQMKAGASTGMSSEVYEGTNTPKWRVEWPDKVINVDGLLNYKKDLCDEISFGIGVPPEIRQASDTGSGYSGRAVPKEVFYGGQQHHAEAQIKAARQYWLDGLVAWNYGRDAWFEVEAAPLLASQEQQAAGQGGGETAQVPDGVPGAEPGAEGQPQPGGDGGLDLAELFGGAGGAGGDAKQPEQQQLALRTTETAIGGQGHATPAAAKEDAAVEEIHRAARAAATVLSQQARRDIMAAIRGKPQSLWADAVALVLRKFSPRLGRLLRDARVAAALAGARHAARQAVPTAPRPLTSGAFGQLPPDDPPTRWALPPMPEDHGPGVALPVIDEAVRDLESRQVMIRPHFDALEASERERAFTVAGLEDEASVARVRDLVTSAVADGTTLREFRDEMLDESGSILSPARLETVFRTNVMHAYSNGLDAVLDQPGIGDGFPYAEYFATHDDRTRPEHIAMETAGIGGSGIFRRDDPVFRRFKPPWSWACRCVWSPMTLEQAAARGIPEAQEWLRTGIEPAVPAWVPHPDFNPPAGWQRLALGEATDVTWLSAQHAPKGGVTVGGTAYKGGEFIPGDVMAKATPEEKAAIEGGAPKGDKPAASKEPKKPADTPRKSPSDTFRDSMTEVMAKLKAGDIAPSEVEELVGAATQDYVDALPVHASDFDEYVSASVTAQFSDQIAAHEAAETSWDDFRKSVKRAVDELSAVGNRAYNAAMAVGEAYWEDENEGDGEDGIAEAEAAFAEALNDFQEAREQYRTDLLDADKQLRNDLGEVVDELAEPAVEAADELNSDIYSGPDDPDAIHDAAMRNEQLEADGNPFRVYYEPESEEWTYAVPDGDEAKAEEQK